jgi:hypothetical protein
MGEGKNFGKQSCALLNAKDAQSQLDPAFTEFEPFALPLTSTFRIEQLQFVTKVTRELSTGTLSNIQGYQSVCRNPSFGLNEPTNFPPTL